MGSGSGVCDTRSQQVNDLFSSTLCVHHVTPAVHSYWDSWVMLCMELETGLQFRLCTGWSRDGTASGFLSSSHCQDPQENAVLVTRIPERLTGLELQENLPLWQKTGPCNALAEQPCSTNRRSPFPAPLLPRCGVQYPRQLPCQHSPLPCSHSTAPCPKLPRELFTSWRGSEVTDRPPLVKKYFGWV